jgi:hypothetical protein
LNHLGKSIIREEILMFVIRCGSTCQPTATHYLLFCRSDIFAPGMSETHEYTQASEGIILIEKGEYQCKKCNNIIAIYRLGDEVKKTVLKELAKVGTGGDLVVKDLPEQKELIRRFEEQNQTIGVAASKRPETTEQRKLL